MNVSLTFDDGLAEHLDVVAPILEEHGFRGTFYVHLAAPGFASRIDDWKALAGRGHELGNHTIFHPATGEKEWVPPGARIEEYTPERMALELDVANRILEGLDGRSERTFAFPCGVSTVGRPGTGSRLRAGLGLGGVPETDYTPLLAERFVAARAAGPTAPDPDGGPRRWALPCLPGDGLTGEALVREVGGRLRPDGWLVLMIHGVGGGHGLGVSVDAFEELVAFLAGREEHSVRPVVEVAREVWGTG